MTAHEMVARSRTLPRISDAALRLISLLERPAGATDEVVELIKCDSLLTAKLLRVCNSVAMGLKEPVNSVEHAVLLLGERQILCLVLSLAFGGPMAIPLAAYALPANELSWHAYFAAAAAEAVARSKPDLDLDPSLAFTIGLLHDIGKLVMAQALAEDVHTAVRSQRAAEGLSSVEAERAVLGTDHAEVGACLLYVWRLPDRIVEGVANHHQPVLKPAPRPSALAHVANRIAHLAKEAPDSADYALESDDPVLHALAITPDEPAGLIAAVRDGADLVEHLWAAV